MKPGTTELILKSLRYIIKRSFTIEGEELTELFTQLTDAIDEEVSEREQPPTYVWRWTEHRKGQDAYLDVDGEGTTFEDALCRYYLINHKNWKKIGGRMNFSDYLKFNNGLYIQLRETPEGL